MAADCELGDGCCPHHRHYGLGSPHGCVIPAGYDPDYPFNCVHDDGSRARQMVYVGDVDIAGCDQLLALARERCPHDRPGRAA